MSKPLLSVITPVYNCSRYLRESLVSLLNQTIDNKDFEIIIINDGSTDDTGDVALDVLANGGHHQWSCWRHLENKKIPFRRNEAIGIAKGEYVAIHDGDDISLPHRFESQLNFLESNKDVFCVGGYAEKINLDSNPILDDDGDPKNMTYPPESHEDIVHMVRQKCMNPMIDPTTIFKKKDFVELGKYTLEKAIYTVPDFDLWLRAMQTGKIFANLPINLIKYRTNPDGMTRANETEMIHAHMVVWYRYMKNINKTSLAFDNLIQDRLRKIKEIQEQLDAEKMEIDRN